MTPESNVIAELQPLLDALCEETITPEQLRRLEELVLMHPEAEAHYIRFMSFYADLIGHFVGPPDPIPTLEPTSVSHATPLPTPKPVSPAPPPVTHTPADPSAARTSPNPSPAGQEKSMRRPSRRVVIWSGVLLAFGSLVGYEYSGWYTRSRAVKEQEIALAASRDAFTRAQAEQVAAEAAARAKVAAVAAAEREAAAQFRAAREAARKAVADKDFVVRLTGPAHIQPGAPNKWQIETLHHGAVVRPKSLDVVVKDAKDTELYRQRHEKSNGAVNLELTTAFWEKVKPGTDLFLEVVAHTDDNRKTPLAERLPLARPVYVTHLVTDKPLYKPGETVHFRSLTLDRSSLRPPETDTHLIFRLRDPANVVVPLDVGNGRLLSNLKPVLGPDNKPLRGIGVGEYAISPDAPGGEYKLDLFELNAETSKEVLLETRKFIVGRYVPDTFEKKLEFDVKSYGAGELVQARIEVSRTAGGPMKDAKANVVAAVEGKPFHEQKDARFTVVTDAAGPKTVLNVRFRLPADIFETAKKGVPPSATLSVTIQDGSDAEAIVRPIPLVTKTLNVEFLPEGGEMIEGVPGRVYFMVRTPIGKPADLKGIITDGTNTLAEVSTLTDAENPGVNRGHGAFMLTPKAGTKYFLKLVSPLGVIEPTKDGYELPVAKADGVALTALDAVTPRGGAIRVRLATAKGSKTLHVGAYARGCLIAHQKVVLEANKPVEVSLRGDEAAGGVTRVTVFEELPGEAPGRTALAPRSERLVYRGSGEHLNLNATADNARYTPSGKVRLDLSATNEKGTPVSAVLLVGVVNRSVITMADNKTDRLLPTHFLLSGDVKHPAELEHADFLLTDHPKAGVALDLLLGAQGWRRFAEQDVAPMNPADRPEVDRMLVAHGQRTAPPFELLKLEEQRVRAEFQPRLEQARLVTARAEIESNAVGAPLVANVAQTQAAISAAEVQRAAAAAALERYKGRYEALLPRLTPGLVALLVGLFFFILFMAMMSGTATKPAGSSRPFIAGAAAVVVVGMLALTLTNLGSNANSTFSFVGYSIKPPSGGGGSFAPAQGSFRSEPTPTAAAPAPPKSEFMPKSKPVVAPKVLPAGGPPTEPANPTDPKKVNPTVKNDASMPALFNQKFNDSVKRDTAEGLQRDKALIAAAFGKKKSAGDQEGPVAAIPDDPVPEAVVLTAGPFVVREYAHQRDPALGEVRSDFTETVYWHPVLVLPDTGKATVEFQLSDDIARYQVLVAGHTLDGRIGAITKTIEARKPFSLDPKLPLEISHTDVIDTPIRVTNDSDVRRNVAFTTTATGFKAVGPIQDIIDLPPNGKGRKFLKLTADKLSGDATLSIAGTSIPTAAPDAIARTIRVVPDGFPGVGSFSDTLSGRARSSITVPKDVVPGTLKVQLEMYPTSLADLVKGLDGMLREPGGCFEQTSSSNYPNTLILDYLNQSNQANPQVAARAKDFLAKGYNRLTGFECPDSKLGIKRGFEWYGAADRPHEGLTAYGLLQFKDMSRVHPVDPAMLKRTQEFLLSRRDGAGGFKMASARSFGSAPQHTNNAYIVWALVESDPANTENLDLRAEIAALKAEALNENSAGGKDAYFVALVANVLMHRADRETAYKLLDRLEEKNFKDGAVTGAVTSFTRSGGRDLEIEATCIALLGWMRANDPKYATTIKAVAKWISQQRGGYGGFGSTQSTILALKALALHAGKFARPSERGTLRVLAGGKEVAARAFTEADVEVIAVDVPNAETAFRPGERTEIEIVTDAKQQYPFTLSYTYTTLTPLSAEKCAVQISTKLARTEATEGDTVPLAVTLENRQKSGQASAMAIIGIPAGMKVPTDLKQLTDLREKGRISFFETRGRELILYWREMAPEEKFALTIDLVCDVPGTYRGPASRGYLYYDADHKHWVEPLSVKIAPLAGGE